MSRLISTADLNNQLMIGCDAFGVLRNPIKDCFEDMIMKCPTADDMRLLEKHGRLIDADELLDELENIRKNSIETDGYYLSGLDDAIDAIATMPTIIPATGSEENS